ncbi:ABR054Cp [Eremothecium gossypii ATCC 10895]|uniref:Spindle pole body component SPC42 n=1 Tax=Eremothecium gossypii (strain ATCC 10895 / CBS 109.51 / FGSC 9923 / NRRL Y-1056) TaxID=284811 RepID=SPC42_EREGS|nr:ABR054Cp [Eremothecium gossypii ATCC 10895]Q75DH2.1 RecName: Full=Spindle pole body component SPC42 [Eremothecium gossypii ATCC 10895]AAS50824.1 ABR054Cp [Eremothecium gossypii ATCC 10895]
MNISPTPKRYQSSNHMPRAVNHNYHSAVPAYHEHAAGQNADRIVPDEYKINSNMISSLIKQNKDLLAKLDEKDRELEKLNVLVGSLRGKLIKYTELNKKLQAQAQAARVPSPPEPAAEPAADYLQLPRRAPAAENDKKIGELYDKLEQLTKVVHQQHLHDPPAPARPRSPARSRSPARTAVSDDDIMISESSELKRLEEQVDQLKRKVLIKSENELRKLSLNQQLADLMHKLGVSSSSPASSALLFDRQPSPTSAASSAPLAHAHCEQCHHAEDALKKPAMDIKNALQTPTPSRTRRDAHPHTHTTHHATNALW